MDPNVAGYYLNTPPSPVIRNQPFVSPRNCQEALTAATVDQGNKKPSAAAAIIAECEELHIGERFNDLELSRLSNQVVRLADYKKQFMDGSSLLKSGESSRQRQGEYYGEEMDEEEEKSLGQILQEEI